MPGSRPTRPNPLMLGGTPGARITHKQTACKTYASKAKCRTRWYSTFGKGKHEVQTSSHRRTGTQGGSHAIKTRNKSNNITDRQHARRQTARQGQPLWAAWQGERLLVEPVHNRKTKKTWDFFLSCKRLRWTLERPIPSLSAMTRLW